MTDTERVGVNELVDKLNIKEGEICELRIKITELQELLTDCLFYCDHIDPYYNECLTEDNIFERAEKLGVKYEMKKEIVLPKESEKK